MTDPGRRRPVRVIRTMGARTRPGRAGLRQLERAVSWLVILRAGAFDVAWYRAQRGGGQRDAGGVGAALWAAHYVWRGRGAGLSPHPLFEAEFAFPDDWATGGPDPLARLLRGRPRYPVAPHPLVDPAVWLAAHPEATRHRYGWFGHLIATAGPTTPLPLPGWARPGPATPRTVERARGLALAGVAAWRADERLRRAPRVTSSPPGRRPRARVAPIGASAPPAAEIPAVGPGPGGGSGGPLVSVVMAVRDRADVVGAAVASVLAQTLTDLELLVVDDGSVDATRAAIAAAAGPDPRLIVASSPGRGVSAARNAGAAAARGRYVAWLDSDNVWRPDHLRTMVGALRSAGALAGYAAVEAVTADGRRRYRSFDPGADEQVAFLQVANHVDLNVLVVARDLLERVGGFDESLARTVDYDLVWRLALAQPLLHVPVIGVSYVEDDRADRITVREPAAWREVVKNRRLIDWPALRATAGDRAPGRISVLVAASGSWQGAWTTARSALEGAPDHDVEVAICDDRTPRGSGLVLRALAALDARVTVARTPVQVHRALATNLAFAGSTGAVVVPVREGTRLWPGWASAADALADDDVLAVALPVIDEDGVLATAGGVATGGHRLAADLLTGLPLADAERLAGDGCRVHTPGDAVALLRAGDLAGADGLDPLLVDGGELADLVLRLGARDTGPAGTGAARVALVPAGPAQRRPGPGLSPAARALLGRRHDLSTVVGADRLWARAGFRVREWAPPAGEAGTAGADPPAVPVPALERVPRPDLSPGGGRSRPRLRWSIATAAPGDPAALHWGDHHFAVALARALDRLGQETAVDHRDAHDRASGRFDDVVVVLRGLRAVPRPPGRTNQLRLLWVISHPDRVDADEVAGYDLAFAASLSWGAGLVDRHGGRVRALLQASDPRRFNPGAAAVPAPAENVLFVGNSRGVYRPAVRTLVEAGVDVAVYGTRWAEFLGPDAGRLVRAAHVPNQRLAPLYARAGVVLNDHWEDMRAAGFASNRLFDAAACGARVLTDEVAGVEDLFGGLVRSYAGPRDLLRAVREAPTGWPDDSRRAELAAGVAAEHSFDARAATLLDAVLALR